MNKTDKCSTETTQGKVMNKKLGKVMNKTDKCSTETRKLEKSNE